MVGVVLGGEVLAVVVKCHVVRKDFWSHCGGVSGVPLRQVDLVIHVLGIVCMDLRINCDNGHLLPEDEGPCLAGPVVGVDDCDTLHARNGFIGPSVSDPKSLSFAAFAWQGLMLPNKRVVHVCHGVLYLVDGLSRCLSADSHSAVLELDANLAKRGYVEFAVVWWREQEWAVLVDEEGVYQLGASPCVWANLFEGEVLDARSGLLL